MVYNYKRLGSSYIGGHPLRIGCGPHGKWRQQQYKRDDGTRPGEIVKSTRYTLLTCDLWSSQPNVKGIFSRKHSNIFDGNLSTESLFFLQILFEE